MRRSSPSWRRNSKGRGDSKRPLVPGGATNTNSIAPNAPWREAALIQPEVMQAPIVWLASDASQACNGRRLIACGMSA